MHAYTCIYSPCARVRKVRLSENQKSHIKNKNTCTIILYFANIINVYLIIDTIVYNIFKIYDTIVMEILNK